MRSKQIRFVSHGALTAQAKGPRRRRGPASCLHPVLLARTRWRRALAPRDLLGWPHGGRQPPLPARRGGLPRPHPQKARARAGSALLGLPCSASSCGPSIRFCALRFRGEARVSGGKVGEGAISDVQGSGAAKDRGAVFVKLLRAFRDDSEAREHVHCISVLRRAPLARTVAMGAAARRAAICCG